MQHHETCGQDTGERRRLGRREAETRQVQIQSAERHFAGEQHETGRNADNEQGRRDLPETSARQRCGAAQFGVVFHRGDGIEKEAVAHRNYGEDDDGDGDHGGTAADPD